MSGIADINKIVDEAAKKKDFANAQHANFKTFLEAKELYKKAYYLCKNMQIDGVQKDILCATYKYEELDCTYSYQIKVKKFRRSSCVNSAQKKIVNGFLKKYSLQNLTDDRLIHLYDYFVYKQITIGVQEAQSYAKIYLDNENYERALYYYKRAEEHLASADISRLNAEYLRQFNLNFHIIKFNVVQCRLGILRNEEKEDELLTKATIESLLYCIKESEELYKLSSDPIYLKGSITLKRNIEITLNRTALSWEYLLRLNKNNPDLISAMTHLDRDRYSSIISKADNLPITKDRFLFYTHGFNTRGKWKEVLTEHISDLERTTDIHFIQRPWDYGTFIIQFFIPAARKKIVRDFWELCQKINDRYGSSITKCLIAHSFGTYATGTALQIYGSLKFERIIYLGNILDVNYDWDKLKANGQIDKVYVVKSTNDWVIALGQIYRSLPWIRWIGAAGKVGFNKSYSFVTIEETQSGHSGMINEENMTTKWFKFLTS